MSKGGIARSYDNGGMLPPGLSLAYNGTGRGERVGAGATVAAGAVQVNFYGQVDAGTVEAKIKAAFAEFLTHLDAGPRR